MSNDSYDNTIYEIFKMHIFSFTVCSQKHYQGHRLTLNPLSLLKTKISQTWIYV